MEWLWITLLLLVSDIHTIQTHLQRPVRFIDNQRHFRHIDSSVSTNFDWELSLREATVQALYREHVDDPNLRKHIYSAPLLGKQNKATPFGDIAILARGQLYANYAGYIFVQDPYQNNCDDCYNIDEGPLRARCIANNCQIWHPRNNEHVIVLWSIKRIRHRSEGHNKIEFEYTISPVGFRHSKERYVTKDGTFNYNLPGHVFLLKSSETHQNLDNVPSKLKQFHPGALVAQTLDGTKYILHSFPGILALEPPGYQTTTKNVLPTSITTTTQDPKKVYQTLLEVLYQKTSTGAQGFTPEPPKTTIAAGTTLVQFTDIQVIPMTDLGSSFITKTTPNYVTIRFPETPTSQTNGKYTSVTPIVFKPSTNEIPPTTSQTSIKPSTPHDFYTTPFLTTPTRFQPVYTEPQKPITTKPHMKTTFHFFAAEEPTIRPITTTQQYTENEIFSIESVKPTKPTRITTLGSTKTTQRFKETTTKWPVTTVRPATVGKVTQPIRTTYAITEQTTKPAYSDFSIPIVVVEEDTSVGTTAQEPTTTNNQFHTTTIPPYQETTTIGTTRVTPTYVTNNEDIKTTIGVTRIMSTIQNLNTGMTFYAAEDTESTASSSNKPTTTRREEIETTFTSGSSSTTKVTPTSMKTAIPKKIDKVTVKATSFYPEEELFGLTKHIPKKSKPTKSLKVSPTQASDFLVDENPQQDRTPLFKKPSKDYNEDDIFGSTKTTIFSSKKPTTREYSKSDLEKALFDLNNNRRSKALNKRKSSTTEATPSKFLYSSYFETSTLPMTTETPQATTSAVAASLVPKRKLKVPLPKLKKIENPVTSQSYLTSISYEVNKIEKPQQTITTQKKESKATIERINPAIRDSEEDDFALRLVGQAKGVAYLDQTSTTGASTAASVSVKTTKMPKYTRRRSYIARAKRPVRKKIVKEIENTK
ncbi:unnamed protein product [Ceutorhynchus assimilis]|uniref:Uncharacterized protein n=1 Tax=Ceutorhynchus assimilis TaxID=467358 RepID=A0A9N9QSL7_9CUCU|nr:unnamed protein product [Ceutorhynchus assimilis]